MELVDTHGRPVHDLRIAVTAACPLACSFCHREGVSPRADEMTVEEIERVVRVGSQLGIESVKLTGGEPLVREHLPAIVERIDHHVDEVSLVTNGRRLPQRAQDLANAGLDRVNVSLHTLKPDRYEKLTGGEGPPLAGIRAAKDAGLPIKVNVVVSTLNDDEIDDIVAWARQTRTRVQLIEIHGPPEQWSNLREQYVSLEGVQERLEDQAERVTRHRMHERPRYHLEETQIDVTRPMWNASFCSACTRLRLTADGRFQTCLLRPVFVDLLEPLREGCSDERLRDLFQDATSLREPTWTEDDPEIKPRRDQEEAQWASS